MGQQITNQHNRLCPSSAWHPRAGAQLSSAACTGCRKGGGDEGQSAEQVSGTTHDTFEKG